MAETNNSLNFYNNSHLPNFSKDMGNKIAVEAKTSNVALEQLIKSNLGLVLSEAMKNKNPSDSNFDDYVQEGIIGIYKAVNKFDSEQYNIKFSTYAINWIRSTMQKYRIKNKVVRLPKQLNYNIFAILKYEKIFFNEYERYPSNKELALILDENYSYKYSEKIVEDTKNNLMNIKNISIHDPLNNDDDNDNTLEDLIKSDVLTPDEEYYKKDLKNRINNLLSSLDERDRRIIELRYGLNEEEKEYTLLEIGQIYKISNERVRQLEDRAMVKLKQRKNKFDFKNDY